MQFWVENSLRYFLSGHIFRVFFILSQRGPPMNKKNGTKQDMNLMKLTEQYSNDDACRDTLEKLRWHGRARMAI